jgi:3-oxoacyl-[acyl-carrier protein] reductase
MSGSLQGKVAIVTGASKGIGAGIAKAFAAQGASVIVNYASSRAGAEAVVAEIKAAGGKAVALQGSVAKEAEVKRLFVEALEAFGRLDILVNNAGVYQFGALEDVTEAEFHRQFDTNVLGPILATREAVKLFPAEGGSIINVSSIASEKGLPGATIYGATKGALDQITRTHAIELAPRKIRVNTIAPGGVETEGTHTAGIIGSEMETQMIAGTPLGRLGQPDDVAGVAVFLASDASRWVTGDRIRVAGGFR